MKYSVFIATSADGYIATNTGSIDWLSTAGQSDVDMGEEADMGFSDFLDSIDCMIMGRKTMEKIASFNLNDKEWPYGDLPIFVLSKTLESPPKNLGGKVEIHNGGIDRLVSRLEIDGFQHAYIDGGKTITSFLGMGLITDIIITRTPIILGGGIPLFGKLCESIQLNTKSSRVFPNGFIQIQGKNRLSALL